MNTIKLSPLHNELKGKLEVPGDKSISHRAVIFGSLAAGKTKVSHFLDGEDCLRTVEAFRLMGVDITQDGNSLLIDSKGADYLKEPEEPLYFGNSGTTTRLMLGVLAGLPHFTTIYGDASLVKRPMDRVVQPLSAMEAKFNGRKEATLLPIAITGNKLKAIDYELPVKSAQVKSAILLAGLLAEGKTSVTEKTQTRNHTENMLKAFGADITSDGRKTTITNKNSLQATDVYVPGDISSAAFFLAAAGKPGSNLTLEKVGLNETRTGIIDALTEMGADIEIRNKQTVSGELLGDITVKHSKLSGTVISGDIIPRLIDEIPIIALIATQANGKTIIRDAEELRVKETDRIAAVVDVLTTLGASVTATDDGMVIEGKGKLKGGKISSYDDHRIAMMGVMASLFSTEEIVIDDVSSIAVSYPHFFNDFKKVTSN